MARLEGVKPLDMTDGKVTRVAYNGEDYVLTNEKAEVGDLIFNIWASGVQLPNSYYEVVEVGNYTLVNAEDGTDHGWHNDTQGEFFEVFRRHFKKGDVVEVVGSSAFGEFEEGSYAKVVKETGGGEYRIESLKDSRFDYIPIKNIKRVDDDRAAVLIKRAEIGRDPYEYKVGDFVRIVKSSRTKPVGTIFEVKNVGKEHVYDEKGYAYLTDCYIELVAPVESRFDKLKEVN